MRSNDIRQKKNQTIFFSKNNKLYFFFFIVPLLIYLINFCFFFSIYFLTCCFSIFRMAWCNSIAVAGIVYVYFNRTCDVFPWENYYYYYFYYFFFRKKLGESLCNTCVDLKKQMDMRYITGVCILYLLCPLLPVFECHFETGEKYNINFMKIVHVTEYSVPYQRTFSPSRPFVLHIHFIFPYTVAGNNFAIHYIYMYTYSYKLRKSFIVF